MSPSDASNGASRVINLQDSAYFEPSTSRKSSKAKANKRRSLPKSRTGCRTCKTRRVKCDEEFPTCRRCRTFGVECNGYAHLPKAKAPALQNPKTHLVLVPKPYTQPRALGAAVHTGPRFTDQTEARYFHYYCTEIAGKIAAECKSSVWDQIIPQAGESEGFIAQGIAALGALSLSRDMPRTSLSSSRETSSAVKWNHHYQYALKQYCKALKSMREGLQESIWGRTRTALIASLIIFCVESLLDNADSASLHASRSINLLYQWRNQHAVSGKPLCAQDMFEEDLYPVFPGLDLQSLLHLDDRPQSVHYGFQRYLDLGYRGAPAQSATLNDFVEACRNLLRRSLHFIAAWRELAHYPGITTLNESLSHGKAAWSVALGQLSIPRSKRVEQKAYLADISHYRTALDDFLRPWSPSEPEFYAGAICKIHTAMNNILLTGSCFPPRMSWDSQLPDFREVVTLCNQIYPQASANGGSTYGFDLGLIVPLSVVATRCRDPALRRQAIGMLLSKPGYREGIWDAEAMGHVCKWIVAIEEEARVSELSYVARGIEGEGRLVKDEVAVADTVPTVLMIQFKMDERKAKVFCAIHQGEKAGRMVVKEKEVSW